MNLSRSRRFVVILTAVLAIPAFASMPASAVPGPTENPGTLQSWGLNGEGQLGIPGDNTGLSYPTPAAVDLPVGTQVVQVATGDGHALALTATGLVYAWGDGTNGDLGQGSSTSEERTPVEVQFPPGTEIASLAAGQYVSYAVTAAGQVYSWGVDMTGQLGDGQVGAEHEVNGTPALISGLSGVTQVAAAGSIYSGWAAALTASGQVYTWGSENAGDLGNGVDGEASNGVDHGDVQATPAAISLSGVTQVAAGPVDGFALDAAGTAYGWGVDTCEELGNNEGNNCNGTDVQTTPTEVDFPAGVKVTSIGFGGTVPGHGIASDSNGTVYIWGQGTAYSEGKYFTPTPFEVPGDAPAAAVEATTFCNYVLTAGGTLYSNGDSEGYCGFGTAGSSLLSPLLPVPMPSGDHVTGFDGGSAYGADMVTASLGPGPTVTSVSPASGPAAGGNTVTVRGTGFGIGVRVFFGTATATNVVVDSAKELTATAPAGSGTVDVMVAVSERNSAPTGADHYTYESAPGSGEPGGHNSGSGGKSGSGHENSGSGAVARLGGVKLSGAGVTLSVSCAPTASPSCPILATLTSSDPVGKRALLRSTVLGRARAKIPAGHSRRVTVVLDGKGRQQLAARHRLQAELTVTSAGRPVGRRGLTFRLPRRRR